MWGQVGDLIKDDSNAKPIPFPNQVSNFQRMVSRPVILYESSIKEQQKFSKLVD